MRIRFIADIRSLIARNWISYFPQAGHEVRVISTFLREQNVIPGTTIHALPLAFSWAGETSKNNSTQSFKGPDLKNTFWTLHTGKNS